MAGLVTRIGQWIDSKWEASVKTSELKALEEKFVALDKETFTYLELAYKAEIAKLKEEIGAVTAKDVADMKTRLEKLEMYTGFTRKPDPLGNAQVKSAFQL